MLQGTLPEGTVLCADAALPPRFNAAEWFVGRHVAEGRGARVALETDDGTLTYAQLDVLVRGFAAYLRLRGLHAGERVAIILPDCLTFAVAFWGAVAAGCVAVPLNPLLTAADLRAILEDCGARMIVGEDCKDGVALVPDDAECVGEADALMRAGEATPVTAYAPTHRDALAFFLYSSGTTGEPKGVVHLQHDMWVCARTYAEQVLRITPDDRAFSIAKLFFAYGLGNALYFPNDVGAACVLYRGRPLPDAIFQQVSAHRPTLFFGVPSAYALMLAAMDDGAPYDFSSVRACVSAGEALPPGIFQRWRERTGLEITDGIGSTEILHIFLSNTPGDCTPGSSGRAVPGYEVKIVDEAGAECGTDAVGDLLVRGDSTMAFYWNKHERTKATLNGEWIRTGDKYRRDAQGRYWHAGRSDDMLKVGGIWVSPVEVEGVVALHEAVLECAVVGRPDVDGLTKPHAYVVLKAPRDESEMAAELKTFVKSRLAPYKYPRWISVVDALPKTATGKTQRFVLRSRTEA
ncbi:MAG: benzoate-CoA ligase family protein [Candidatus Velthaea sp.]